MKILHALKRLLLGQRLPLAVALATVVLFAGLVPAVLSHPTTSAAGTLTVTAQGTISDVFPLPPGFSIPDNATPVMSITLTSTMPRVVAFKVFLLFPNGSTVPVADEKFGITEIVTTKSSLTTGTVVLSGVILPGAVSPFPDVVGRAVAVSFGYNLSANPVAFQMLTVTAAGSHTTIAATAAGSLTLGGS